MKKSFASKIVVLFITVSVLMSAFSTSTYAAIFLASDVIAEKDIINTGKPIGKWNCNEASGLTVKDSSGNRLHGTFNESYKAHDSFKWVLGRERSAIRCGSIFSGSSNYDYRFVEIPANAKFNYSRTQSYTLMAWIKSEGDQNRWQGVITKGREAGQWYGIWISSNNRWVFGGRGQNIFGPTVTDGWHHVAIVQNGAARKRLFYVDGVRVGVGEALDTNNSAPLLLGKAGGLSSENFEGDIDEVYLYNYAWDYGDIFEWHHRMEHTLNVPVYGQMPHGSICWATSASMIKSYFDQSYGDCDIKMAQYIHGADFNNTGTAGETIKVVERYTLSGVDGKKVDRALSFDEIRTQIDNKQPFIASIHREDGSRHMVVIRGYYINDTDPFTASKREYIRMNNPGSNGFSQLVYYPHFYKNSRYYWDYTVTFKRR